MKYTIKENQLNYETYYTLRKSVGWNNWSKEQAEKAFHFDVINLEIFIINRLYLNRTAPLNLLFY